MTTLRGTLRLARVSLALSPIADGLAGAALASAAGLAKDSFELTMSLVASLACFLFGMIQNDVCDREIDRARGGRPLVTGEVSLVAAKSWMVGAATLALASSALASSRAAILVVVLLAAITTYNAAPSHLGLCGPFLLGAIRGTNLLLGASTALDAAAPVAAVYAGFIAAIAFVGRMEDGALAPSAARVAVCGLAAIAFGFASPWAVALGSDRDIAPWVWLGPCVIAIWLGLRFRELSREPIRSGPRLARFVGAALSMIFVFDAGVAAASDAPVIAAILLLMFGASRVLVRSFPPS